jgi:hypothetical protein
MLAFLTDWFRPSQVRRGLGRKPRPVRLELQALEDRQLCSVSVARYGGNLESFAIGKQDAQVYAQRGDINGIPEGFAFLTALGAVKAISAVNLRAGVPTVFAIGLDDQVYEQQFDPNGSSLGAWRLAAPGQVKTMNLTPNYRELVVIGLDDQVYSLKLDAFGDAQGGYSLTTSGQVKAISVTYTNTFYGLVVFAIGLDDQVYAQKLDTNGRSITPYFLTRPGAVKTLTTTFYNANSTFLTAEVFVIGLDDQVYAQKFDLFGNSASGYVLTRPGQVKALAVNSTRADGNPEMFAIGLDDQVYAQKFDNHGDSASGYFLTRPGQVKAIAVGYEGSSIQNLFAIGLDDRVYGQQIDFHGNPMAGYYLILDHQVM